jgi:predicted anti-sigma-YlaC factor YlaD
MNCEKYQELLSDLVDGMASSDDRTSVEAHLNGCVVCAEIRDDFVAIAYPLSPFCWVFAR